MSDTITYPTPPHVIVTTRDTKLILRLRQLARQHRGQRIEVRIIINEDGEYGLIPPPPNMENIG